MARAISADAGSARCDGVRDTKLNAQTLPGRGPVMNL
jgi:hypothetical protein